jgi:hypothetical protein
MVAWSSSYITNLPDSAFACIDSDGRHYPHHDAQGKLDLPHLRNGRARARPQGTASCGYRHLFEVHKLPSDRSDGKAMEALKATILDDDAFRLLAHPFSGPVPYPASPKGADLDRQWYSERTDFKTDWFPFRLVDWHHRSDAPSKADILGKAVDPEVDDEGQWVTVWLKHGERRVELIRRIAEMGGQIFGSSEAVPGLSRVQTKAGIVPWERDIPGEIVVWPYMRQALSTSPQNTHSVIRPLKATLDDLAATGDAPTAAFFDDLATFLDSLAPSSETGKAGRVLAARNEARLLEAREHIDEAYYDPKRRRAALTALAEVLDELNRYLHPDT